MPRTHDTALAIMFNKPAALSFDARVRNPAYKMKLTEEQEKVRDFANGVAIVSARPGSGKSATGVEHVRTVADTCDVRTFHSYMMRDIWSRPQDFGFRRKPRLELGGYFGLLNEATRSNYKSWDDSPWDSDLVSWAQNTTHTKDLEKLAEEADTELAWSTVEDLETMRKWMQRREIITFDDVLRLYSEPENLEYLETHFTADHIFVDEFQDVNPFQLQAVIAMARSVDTKSLIAVGDPNQSIYTFRGSVPASFDTFMEELPQAVELKINTNFRSRDEILAMAETVCKEGMRGVRGSDPESVCHGFEPEKGHPFRSEDWKKCAVLCRYNRDVAAWQLTLTKLGVPSMSTGKGDFWKAKHVKMALDYRGNGGYDALVDDWKWRKMLDGKRFQGDEGEDHLREVEDDARWVLGLTEEDLGLAQNMMQNPEGVTLSTIHKSKGCEWPEVLIHNADERLQRETFLWYVAITRAEDYLVIG